MFRTQCISCRSNALNEIINLGMHPMADTFIPESRLAEPDRSYPLVCDLCKNCGHVQSRTITSPDERYVIYDYSYTSANSQTSRSHWQEYAIHVGRKTGLAKSDFVLEVGSNDGFLAEQFQRAGYMAIGVDPSPAMALLAAQRQVKTIAGLFGLRLMRENLSALPSQPRLIVANNVFNHANDPLDFALGIKEILAPNGTFVFELPYWATSVAQKKFDQIYHEHVSYMTVKSAVNLFNSIGLRVSDVEEVDYHGGSIRVYVNHASASNGGAVPPAPVAALVAREEASGLFEADTYRSFMQEITQVRLRFLARFYHLKEQGHSVLCVGAAAKGNTFLNYYNLDSTVVDFVTDASPSKIGKFTPRTRIPITRDAVFKDYGSVYALILSWNISYSLQKLLLSLNSNIKFLDPYNPLNDT